MLKEGIEAIQKKGINYIKEGNEVKKHQPWMGDIVNAFYDFFMKKTIFPKKFGGDIHLHYQILKQELKNIRQKYVLELATGSGNAVYFLNNDNHYTGIDISPGLLRRAVRRFRSYGFKDSKFYLISAHDLPFRDNSFDLCMCHLSFNFFPDLKKTIQEISRLTKNNGLFLGSVPVPERKRMQTTIRGHLFTESEIKTFFENEGWHFHALQPENGCLLYFKAIKSIG